MGCSLPDPDCPIEYTMIHVDLIAISSIVQCIANYLEHLCAVQFH